MPALLVVIVSLSAAPIAQADSNTPASESVVLISAEPSLVVRAFILRPYNVSTTHA